MNHKVLVTSERDEFRGMERRVRSFARDALTLLRKTPCAMECVLVTPKTIHMWNKKYRGKDMPTTVLSFGPDREFPHPELPKGVRYLGEIVLAPRVVAERGEDPYFLVLHSILHLLVYTHERADARMRMEQREHTLWRALKKKKTHTHV